MISELLLVAMEAYVLESTQLKKLLWRRLVATSDCGEKF